MKKLAELNELKWSNGKVKGQLMEQVTVTRKWKKRNVWLWPGNGVEILDGSSYGLLSKPCIALYTSSLLL